MNTFINSAFGVTSVLQDQGLLLAHLSDISRYSRSYVQNQQYTLIFTILGGIVLACLLAYCIGQLLQNRTLQQAQAKAAEKPLLRQIAEALQLSHAEENLILRMASRNEIQPPEVLLVDPALWNLCFESSPHERPQLLELAEKLFGAECCRQHLRNS